MAAVQTRLTRAQYGFHFVNRFDLPDKIKLNVPFANALNLDNIVYGLCGGMCFAAQDFFYAERPIPVLNDPEKLPPGFVRYLTRRQIDSLGITTIPKVIEWMLRDDIDVGRRTVQYEVPKLRRRIDRGNPAVLALIRQKGFGNPTLNHQVLATGYDLDPAAGRLTISLYEPNYPGLDPTISLDLSSPSKGINISQSTGEALRGFFVIEYKPQTPPDLSQVE